jgi:hypothetical protein
MAPLVFISCGQYTEQEKDLGNAVAAIVQGLGFDPYFAENQSSLKGLHENILSKLNECSGFIAIAHPRGKVSFPGGGKPHTRASVWIEQEIAIASFIAKHSGRSVEVAAFIHEDIKKLEGLRALLQLNPIRFRSDDEVLEQLPGILKKWTAVGSVHAKLNLSYEEGRITGDRHDYVLVVSVTNPGTHRLTEYQMDLMFPDAFLDQTVHFGHEVPDRRTTAHRMFRLSEKEYLNAPIFPGDTMVIFKLPYFVDHTNYYDSSAMAQMVKATLHLGEEEPVVVERSIQNFQVF